VLKIDQGNDVNDRVRGTKEVRFLAVQEGDNQQWLTLQGPVTAQHHVTVPQGALIPCGVLFAPIAGRVLGQEERGILGAALQGLAKKSKAVPLEIKFAWEERGETRVEDLRDLLGLESVQKREAFLRGLTFYPRGGLGQEHVRADPARLPASAGPTRVLVAVRLVKAVPEK
jgi:hypothetical protein